MLVLQVLSIKPAPSPVKDKGWWEGVSSKKAIFVSSKNANGRLFMRRGGKREQEEVLVLRVSCGTQ